MNTLRRTFAATLLVAATLTTGCGEPPPEASVFASIDPNWRPPALPAGFSARAVCEPMGVYAGPTAGSTFIYRRADGTLSSREVLSVRNGRVEFRYRDLAQPDLEPLPPRYALAGMLVDYPDRNSARKLDYTVDPLTILSKLKPGSIATIPTVETSTLMDRARRVSFPTTITYRTCGALSLEGKPHQVRVYDVASSRRVVDRKAGDRIRESHVTYFLSDEWGYPLAIQDEGAAIAVRMVPPGRTAPPNPSNP